ncbi:TetR/AcrR family transcriptional regulator [Oceanicella actignis]|uniref:Transcriptional regulator, TetR family n=1 Tax=Oceanicella actignis TaxID=1189325 RepID=A0A1M7SID2_9RHOB|nr:TetR/AcrR family transcriptional regulator [Oceanicella actignis]SET17790.1 transcriptional regulator, TetR family [Oceanicella actignis]SHN58256.1 transcriptional regulator, TetR family [Oceanicella actignis]
MTIPHRNKQAAQAGETRARILDAAARIARERGARHVTIDAVTAASGLSKGGVLYHFPSKAALLAALIAREVEALRARCDAHREAARGAPNPTLRGFLSALEQMMDEGDRLPMAILAASAEDPALLDPVRAEFRARWARIAAETAAPDRAFAIWSAIEGLRLFDMFAAAPEGRAQIRAALPELRRMIEALPGKEPTDDQ